ncbi:YdeI/OmpD-associated family protein [Asticcacaulis sp. 201]|uniref:YdeI/OmpD-associated family protein n=1 Tax=Asticcacaulis sp. 201 TaxID=3028787 RepID=UPI0029160E47|nr:YdeI/OmpD-associated family protein [Asticcacaulis sp. 201]MDV6329764.1 YdeI/OmpD-associated family protein [Asticcacaulis sp. 201]
MPTDGRPLTRDIHPMPDDIRRLLKDRGLYDTYEGRPPYQQNDYIGWIDRAKREETRQKRIDQMLDELEAGGLYMKMRWTG